MIPHHFPFWRDINLKNCNRTQATEKIRVTTALFTDLPLTYAFPIPLYRPWETSAEGHCLW